MVVVVLLQLMREQRYLTKLWWARILVNLDGRVLPKSLVLNVGKTSFSLQLWWEFAPCVVPKLVPRVFGKKGEARSRGEEA